MVAERGVRAGKRQSRKAQGFAHLSRPPQLRVFFQAGLRACRRSVDLQGNHLPMPWAQWRIGLPFTCLPLRGQHRTGSGLRPERTDFPFHPSRFATDTWKKWSKASNTRESGQ